MTVTVPTNLKTMSLFQHFIDVALCPSKASAAVQNHKSLYLTTETDKQKLSKTTLAPSDFSISAMPITSTYSFFLPPLKKKITKTNHPLLLTKLYQYTRFACI